jgi:hypothetical protein
MVQDLITMARFLMALLRTDPLLKMFLPILTLMGSIVEGTRIGAGNETDLLIEFEGIKRDKPPFKVEKNDPFHLKATKNIPVWMEKYLDIKRRFIFHKFMKDLLDAVTSCLDQLYNDGNEDFTKRLLRVKKKRL